MNSTFSACKLRTRISEPLISAAGAESRGAGAVEAARFCSAADMSMWMNLSGFL